MRLLDLDALFPAVRTAAVILVLPAAFGCAALDFPEFRPEAGFFLEGLAGLAEDFAVFFAGRFTALAGLFAVLAVFFAALAVDFAAPAFFFDIAVLLFFRANVPRNRYYL
jgi:hypothetical protein